ncbi:hypothetical protein BC826DRAFT_966309 [Russula brevipes]|nr:hypothetical protein BC826DRAFT_966309 [Russula brevipes]
MPSSPSCTPPPFHPPPPLCPGGEAQLWVEISRRIDDVVRGESSPPPLFPPHEKYSPWGSSGRPRTARPAEDGDGTIKARARGACADADAVPQSQRTRHVHGRIWHAHSWARWDEAFPDLDQSPATPIDGKERREEEGGSGPGAVRHHCCWGFFPLFFPSASSTRLAECANGLAGNRRDGEIKRQRKRMNGTKVGNGIPPFILDMDIELLRTGWASSYSHTTLVLRRRRPNASFRRAVCTLPLTLVGQRKKKPRHFWERHLWPALGTDRNRTNPYTHTAQSWYRACQGGMQCCCLNYVRARGHLGRRFILIMRYSMMGGERDPNQPVLCPVVLGDGWGKVPHQGAYMSQRASNIFPLWAVEFTRIPTNSSVLAIVGETSGAMWMQWPWLHTPLAPTHISYVPHVPSGEKSRKTGSRAHIHMLGGNRPAVRCVSGEYV